MDSTLPDQFMDSLLFKSHCINRGLCFATLEESFTKMKYLLTDYKGAIKLAGVDLIRTLVTPVAVCTHEDAAPWGEGELRPAHYSTPVSVWNRHHICRINN